MWGCGWAQRRAGIQVRCPCGCPACPGLLYGRARSARHRPHPRIAPPCLSLPAHPPTSPAPHTHLQHQLTHPHPLALGAPQRPQPAPPREQPRAAVVQRRRRRRCWRRQRRRSGRQPSSSWGALGRRSVARFRHRRVPALQAVHHPRLGDVQQPRRRARRARLQLSGQGVPAPAGAGDHAVRDARLVGRLLAVPARRERVGWAWRSGGARGGIATQLGRSLERPRRTGGTPPRRRTSASAAPSVGRLFLQAASTVEGRPALGAKTRAWGSASTRRRLAGGAPPPPPPPPESPAGPSDITAVAGSGCAAAASPG